jgi:hypothetical protein
MNPTYFATYLEKRRTHNRTESRFENPPNELSNLVNWIKNNVASDIKPIHTTMWVLGSSEKNTFAAPQVIVLYGKTNDVSTASL